MSPVDKLAEKRCGTVVPKASGVDPRRNEVVAKRVHLHDWRVADGIAEVEGVNPLGEGWARRRFARNDLGLGATCKVLANEWEGKSCEVAATTDTPVDLVGIFASKVELAKGFLTDDGLVHENVVEHRPEGVLGIVMGRCVFDRFGDRDTQGSGRIWIIGQDLATGIRQVGRAGENLGTKRFHEGSTVGLLGKAHLHHVDGALNANHLAGDRQSGSPLSRTGLGRDALCALFLVIEGLGQCSVDLVRAGRASTLVLVVDMRRGIKQLFEPTGPDQWAWTEKPVCVADGVWDVDPTVCRYFLLDDFHRKQRKEVSRTNGLPSARVQDWCWRSG